MNTSLAATIFLVFACDLRGQTPGSVIEDELKQLSHPSSRPVNVSCGSDHRNRLTASSLAEGGRAAIPILVGALSEIESVGPRSTYFANATWILLALSKIQGPSALPLLRRLMNTTEHLQQSLDAAVSLALGITSYVSASSYVIPGGTCNRFGEPRFALGRLALGCQTLDLPMIESALGPTAKLALASLIRRKKLSVIVLRSQIASVDYHSAVGFKLSAPDQWSEPIEPLYPRRVLEQPFETSSALTSPLSVASGTRFTLRTNLYDRVGRDCGTIKLTFSSNPAFARQSPFEYVVDNANIAEVLDRVGFCSGRG